MYCWSASYNAILWQIRQNPKMKSCLPIFAAACWLAVCTAAASAQRPTAAPAPGQADGGNSGEALLERAMLAVESAPSLTAKVRHMVDLGNRRLVGTGAYLQQGRGPTRALRFELEYQDVSQPSRIEQICDGANLWLYQQLSGEENLSWVDMLRLARARPKTAPTSQLSPWNMVGGLPRMLAGLQGAFLFGPVTEARLEDVRAYSTEGAWEPARLMQLLPEQQEAIRAGQGVDLSKLVANLPDRIVLYAGCDDFIPYRIEYWRSSPPGNGDAAQDPGKLIALLELYELRIAGQIDPQQFVCRHGNLKPADKTLEYLDKLGLEEVVPAGAARGTMRRR
jgi:hypothetical protein